MTPLRRAAIGFALFVGVGALVRPAAAGPVVALEGRTLRVHADRVPAAVLLEAVAERTGVRFVIDESIPLRPLTVEIESRDLESGIRLLVSELDGAAGHTMAWAPAADGRLRLVEVAAYGPGDRGSGGTVIGDGDGERGVDAEVERKVLELLRELETARALPEARDLSPADVERVRALRDAGFGAEESAAAVFHATRRERLFEELEGMPGGVDAFHRLKVRSYYEPHEDDGPLPHFFSDVDDPS